MACAAMCSVAVGCVVGELGAERHWPRRFVFELMVKPHNRAAKENARQTLQRTAEFYAMSDEQYCNLVEANDESDSDDVVQVGESQLESCNSDDGENFAVMPYRTGPLVSVEQGSDDNQQVDGEFVVDESQQFRDALEQVKAMVAAVSNAGIDLNSADARLWANAKVAFDRYNAALAAGNVDEADHASLLQAMGAMLASLLARVHRSERKRVDPVAQQMMTQLAQFHAYFDDQIAKGLFYVMQQASDAGVIQAEQIAQQAVEGVRSMVEHAGALAELAMARANESQVEAAERDQRTALALQECYMQVTREGAAAMEQLRLEWRTELHQVLARVADTIAQVQAQHNSLVADIGARFAEARHALISEVEQKMASRDLHLEMKIASAKQHSDALHSKAVALVDGANSRTRFDLQQLNDAIKSAEQRIGALEASSQVSGSEIAQMSNLVRSLRENLRNSQGKADIGVVMDLTQSLDTLRERIARLEKVFDSTSATVHQLSKATGESKNTADSHAQRLDQLEHNFTNLGTLMAKMLDRLEQLDERVKQDQNATEMKRVSDSVSKLSSELAAIKSNSEKARRAGADDKTLDTLASLGQAIKHVDSKLGELAQRVVRLEEGTKRDRNASDGDAGSATSKLSQIATRVLGMQNKMRPSTDDGKPTSGKLQSEKMQARATGLQKDAKPVTGQLSSEDLWKKIFAEDGVGFNSVPEVDEAFSKLRASLDENLVHQRAITRWRRAVQNYRENVPQVLHCEASKKREALMGHAVMARLAFDACANPNVDKLHDVIAKALAKAVDYKASMLDKYREVKGETLMANTLKIAQSLISSDGRGRQFRRNDSSSRKRSSSAKSAASEGDRAASAKPKGKSSGNSKGPQ